MFLTCVFVKKIILKHYQKTSRSFISRRHRNQHVRCWIYGNLFFSNYRVHSKVHFIVNDRFFNGSSINDRLFIFYFSIIHLQTYEHRVIATSVKSDYIYTDTMRFMCLSGRVHHQFLLFPLQNVNKLLFLYGCHHNRSSSWIYSKIMP